MAKKTIHIDPLETICDYCGCEEFMFRNRVPTCIDCGHSHTNYRLLKINGDDHELDTATIETFQRDGIS